MRIILDTNVFVSGVFFAGPPWRILDAWRHGQIELVVSVDILQEYARVAEKLSNQFRGVELEPILHLLVERATIIDTMPLREKVCADPDDDKFIACAISSNTRIIASGDTHLLAISGYKGIEVLKPREIVEKYLKKK